VRNPDGYHHAPYADVGCEMLVKLCQFQADDKERKHVDMRNESGLKHNEGIQNIPLHSHKNEKVALYHLDADTSFDIGSVSRLVELFILKGKLQVNDEFIVNMIGLDRQRVKSPL